MTRLTPTPTVLQSGVPRLLALGGILAAFALRLHKLGADSLWYDETVSVFLAQQSIPDLVAHTARDIHPPGYYLLLHFWGVLVQPALGTGFEFLYAWPSLVWGLLLLPLVFALGRRYFSRRVALMALWLTALSPLHIWYSQEVRMYTLGAVLGLLCLWAASDPWRPHPRAPQRRSLLVYSLAATVGLYTLYYFAFLLIALNSLIVWQHLADRKAQATTRHPLAPWLLANGAVFVLWLPWLPTFWRQMTDPPVPPWRGTLDIAVLVQESLSALIVGQSAPLGRLWLWAGIMALLLVAGAVAARNAHISHAFRSTRPNPVWMLILFIFLPLFCIAVISLGLTPLYHIRYFFIYASAGTLLIGFAVETIAKDSRWLRAMILIGLFAANGWSLHEFWTNPLYAADDHRSAVANLAAGWRPGDAVLVNAGWAYTALAVYWPTTPSPTGSQPAEQPTHTRMTTSTSPTDLPAGEGEIPVIFLGGSVDGGASLGWGLAESDFFPVSAGETEAALGQIATTYRRVWHYRLYDTVSDPTGLIRAWLDTHTSQRLDLPYPGRDYLRLQLYETPTFDNPSACPQTPTTAITFGDDLRLQSATYTPDPQVGSALYATLCWQTGNLRNGENLRTSLRLYRTTEQEPVLVAQQDEAPFERMTTRMIRQVILALPLPGDTAPGSYRLELIVYDGTTGDPLPVNDPQAIVGQRWPLAPAIQIGVSENRR